MFRKNKENTSNLQKKLENVEIPNTLSHLSPNQIFVRLKGINLLKQSRIWLVVGIVLAISITYYSFKQLTSSSQFVVFNFHDDLVELDKTNCTGNKANNINNGGYITSFGDNFYASSDQSIYLVNLSLSQKRTIISGKTSHLNYTNNRLYYINRDDKKIYVYDTLTNEIVPTKLKADQLITCGNYIFFLSADDYHTVYRIDEDFKKLQAITQSGCISFCLEGDWIYYATSQGLYRVPLMGGEVSLLLEGDFLDFIVNQNTIYYRDRNKTLNQIKLDGTGNQTLVNHEVNSYLIVDDSICYTDNTGVFRYYIDMGTSEQLSSENARGLQIIGPWLYYFWENSTEGRFISLDHQNNQITPLYSINENNNKK